MKICTSNFKQNIIITFLIASITAIIYFLYLLKLHIFKKIYLFYFIYLFLERGEGRVRGRETSMWGCLLHVPYWGPGLQSRLVRWLGIGPTILLFAGQHSVYWATPARAKVAFFFWLFLILNHGLVSFLTFSKNIINKRKRQKKYNQRHWN